MAQVRELQVMNLQSGWRLLHHPKAKALIDAKREVASALDTVGVANRARYLLYWECAELDCPSGFLSDNGQGAIYIVSQSVLMNQKKEVLGAFYPLLRNMGPNNDQHLGLACVF